MGSLIVAQNFLRRFLNGTIFGVDDNTAQFAHERAGVLQVPVHVFGIGIARSDGTRAPQTALPNADEHLGRRHQSEQPRAVDLLELRRRLGGGIEGMFATL